MNLGRKNQRKQREKTISEEKKKKWKEKGALKRVKKKDEMAANLLKEDH